jgi:hypothetical protein
VSETGPRDEKLKEIFLASPRGPVLEGCPESGLLWSGARGELSREELGRLVDHVAACGHCTETWRLARELVSSEPGSAARAPLEGEGRGRPWLRWSALAVAAALVVVAGITLRDRITRQEPSSSYREAAQGEIRSLLPEGGTLPRSAFLLRWTDLGEGARYGVTVATTDLEPLVSATALETSELLVPESALADLSPGAAVVWQVEASFGEGRRVVSGTFVQRVE